MTTQSKHFINDPETVVLESLVGLCDLNPHVGLDADNKIVFAKLQDKDKVALVCGGGSGHEPAHAAYVGEGMLTAAVCGNLFASPNASQVRRGIDLVENNKGTVIIVKNYTGDILNFGLAKEQYAASHPAKSAKVRFVIVADDVAVGRTQGKIVGRRGLTGTVLVYKIAGALAHHGASLDEVHTMAEWAANNVVTIGTSLGHTHVPGTAPMTNDLADSELEIGMGIHNESGNRKESPIPPLSDLIAKLLDYLTAENDPERSFLSFRKGDDIVLLVNNLGGVSVLELTGIVAESRKQLEALGFKVVRILSGTFMTSLNMPGFSITLLKLPRAEDGGPSRSQVLDLLDQTPNVPGWPWTPSGPPVERGSQEVNNHNIRQQMATSVELKAVDPAKFELGVRNAAQALMSAEPEITRMDSIAGDGDCGLTLKAGSQAVLHRLDAGEINGSNIVASLIAISRVAEEVMGGTSGALYSIFFSGLAQGLQSQDIASGSTVTPEQWKTALSSSLAKLYGYTRARPPSRTLVDPLAAFVGALQEARGAGFAEAVVAAAKAAEATKDLDAKAGRSAYVDSSSLRKEQIPDPGAWGVKVILEHLGL